MKDETYTALCEAVAESFDDMKTTLGIDTFDKMLQAHGETPTGAGRKGRNDWNYTRNLIRKNLNVLLRQHYGVSLEVKSRSKTEGVKYHLVPIMESMVGRPLEHSQGFKRRIIRHFREINKAVAEEYPPPDGASLDEIKAWEDFALAKAELMQQDYNLSLRYMAKARGLGRYLPEPVLVEDSNKKGNSGP